MEITDHLAGRWQELRAGEARQLVRDGKKSRWCLLKRKETLTDHQRIRLRDILRYNSKSVLAYLLKEDFQQFWDYTSPTWAGKSSMSGAAKSCAHGSNR